MNHEGWEAMPRLRPGSRCPRPHCRGKLLLEDEALKCYLCGRIFATRNGAKARPARMRAIDGYRSEAA